MEFPLVDQNSTFYKNCVRQRKRGAKICLKCPFRKGIERQEKDLKALIDAQKRFEKYFGIEDNL
jgi:hypothetical protein